MKRTLLIAEDVSFIRQHLRDMAEEGGYEVVAAVGDASEAIEAYKTHHPDCVTMDVVMPGNGVVAIQEIIKHDPKARILVVTAVGQRQLIDQAISAGGAATLFKPVSPRQLLSKLDRLFQDS